MFILRSILMPLQQAFPDNKQGCIRSRRFAQVILACIVPFTDSKSSNLLRALQHLMGLAITRKSFYDFMGSKKLVWPQLWKSLWRMIPEPETDNRLLVALDDCTNPKVGKNVFGCSYLFDHAAKSNQSKFPWAQCFTTIGLLKQIKGRWACIPLSYRFYLPKNALQCDNMKVDGKTPVFQSKLEQATDMLTELSRQFTGVSILAVCDSWFGNNGLFAPARKRIGSAFHMLSRLRCSTTLYDMPQPKEVGTRGRSRKYGERLGSATEVASDMKEKAENHTVFLYGKKRSVLASTTVVMLKTLKCPVRVVFVYRKTRWIALFTTDLSLSTNQIIEFYGARWKIESGFKEIKQDIGASSSQMRNEQSVRNHLNFCMMAAAVSWVYAIKLENTPDRRHIVRGRNSFAFSDVRHIIAKAALSRDFDIVCSKPSKRVNNLPVAVLLSMVA